MSKRIWGRFRYSAQRPLASARVWLALLSACAVLVGTWGCQNEKSKVAPPEPMVVPVSQPLAREVTDYVDFTGQTKAAHAVDITPRVTGYLVEMPFKEGAEVKKGDLLFVVDPRPYQAQLDQAQGQVDLNKASLKLAKTTLARDKAINGLSPGSVSQQQFDQEQAMVEEADARVRAAEKSMEIYQLSYGFTKVFAPIDGQISRKYLMPGNLVNQDQTLLTTVVTVDPMYVYFEMDEPTLLRTRRGVNEGKVRPLEDPTKVPVFMGLQGEEGFPHEGYVDFFDNQVNASTGTLLVRGVFPNPLPKGGRRLLSPGMFARIRLPIGSPHQAILVLDRVIQSDQGLKFVYVVEADNKVRSQRVSTGALEDDNMRVIAEGLKPGDWVVSGGLLQVRPRMDVRPDRVPWPGLQQQPVADSTPPASKATPALPAQKSKGSTRPTP
jgi:membrane fusion protein, multidrug efflux system